MKSLIYYTRQDTLILSRSYISILLKDCKTEFFLQVLYTMNRQLITSAFRRTPGWRR